MASATRIQLLQQRALQAEQIIAQLRAQLSTLQNNAIAEACQVEEKNLQEENKNLKNDLEQLKRNLMMAEIQNGVMQVPLPGQTPAVTQTQAPTALTPSAPAVKPAPEKPKPDAKKGKEKNKKGGEVNPSKEQKQAGGADNALIDVSRLDMRVGHIVSAKRHPDADSLYIEEVDLGEERHRTVVSGLVKHVTLDQLEDRLAVFMCNLKPAKMRGVLSEAMVMCASSPDKVEIIELPPGCVKGDRVAVEGYEGTPDAQLNPKKKIWEQVQPDLRINEQGLPCYKGVPWRVGNKGTMKAPTMKDCEIR